MDGELAKLKLISFSDEEANNQDQEFEVQINPEQYKRNFTIQYTENGTPGDKGESSQFERVAPEKMNLQFVIDGTGVVNNDLGMFAGVAGAMGAVFGDDDSSSYVTEMIDQLKTVVYAFKGEVHRTPFVKIVWGEFIFWGVLESLDVTYTLFQPDGKPLRAKIVAAFKEQIPQSQQELVKDQSSPDLTHVRTVNADDNILLMTDRIYKDPGYYLEVARTNNLTNFRKLKTGDTLHFPPFEKSN